MRLRSPHIEKKNMKFEEQPRSTSEDKVAQAPEQEGEVKRSLSAGEIKVNEYVSRIQDGASKDVIFQGLPDSFRTRIEDKLAQSSEESEQGIPPQYRGLNSEILDEIWTIPEYIDRDKTKELRDKKAKAVAALKEKELLETKKRGRRAADGQQITELRQQLGIEESSESPVAGIESETSSSVETKSLSIEERKKLSGFSAGYELAKVAKQQGLNLSTLSREEYADYAIQNFLAIDDSQLRMPPWQRMCESAQEIVAANKEKRALISEESDNAFSKFCFEIQKKAGEDDRFIQDRIRIRQGTKDSHSWLFFKVNNGTTEGSKEVFKSYVSVKDLNKLTPERFTLFMVALRDAGYNGDIKIFQDLVVQGVNLNDQIVMHGASEDDARLALSVAEKFFGDELDQKSVGKDEMVDGKKYSYSEILARKIEDAINTPQKP